MRRFRLIMNTLAVVLAMRAESVWACATCFGAEGDPQTEGLNMAIITLLSVTYTLFSCMALMAYFYWKKNRVLPDDEAGDLEPSSLQEAPTAHG